MIGQTVVKYAHTLGFTFGDQLISFAAVVGLVTQRSLRRASRDEPKQRLRLKKTSDQSEQNPILLQRDLQIGVRDRVQVRLSNFKLVRFPELSLLPVADQLKKRLSVRDWCEM